MKAGLFSTILALRIPSPHHCSLLLSTLSWQHLLHALTGVAARYLGNLILLLSGPLLLPMREMSMLTLGHRALVDPLILGPWPLALAHRKQ